MSWFRRKKKNDRPKRDDLIMVIAFAVLVFGLFDIFPSKSKNKMNKTKVLWWITLLVNVACYAAVPWAVMNDVSWKWIFCGTMFCVIGSCNVYKAKLDMDSEKRDFFYWLTYIKVYAAALMSFILLNPYTELR